MKTKRHPAAIALDKFKTESTDFYKSKTLGRDNADYYLANRIDYAFQSGWNAAERFLSKTNRKRK
jgi:hypothetical protein